MNRTKLRETLAETRVFLDFNAVIVNLALLDDNSASECIANIKNSIHHTKMQISEQLPKHEDIPLFGRTILEQQCMLLETLEKWEEKLDYVLLPISFLKGISSSRKSWCKQTGDK